LPHFVHLPISKGIDREPFYSQTNSQTNHFPRQISILSMKDESVRRKVLPWASFMRNTHQIDPISLHNGDI